VGKMGRKTKLEEIRKHWDEAGKQLRTEEKVTPTSRDPYLALLERENILDYLGNHHIALEIGCGDASHTMHYAKKVKRLSGIDIAESLIDIARKRAISESIQNVDFIVGTVLDIKRICRGRKFNCVISQRCIINLPGWEYQQDGILQVYDVLEKGGLFLLTEGFSEELDDLNVIRRKLGLSEIKVVPYNKNLVRDVFEEFVKQYFQVIEVRHYGAYLFLSRLFHPLFVLPDEPKHDSKINEVAMTISRMLEMPDLEKYSYNLFYVLKKA
jgi:ubiquinone/menaquinone biosynthesis C-methylase UbiE